jgi:hypothetical protein
MIALRDSYRELDRDRRQLDPGPAARVELDPTSVL